MLYIIRAIYAAALFATALADLTPTEPAPMEVFKEGGDCTISWNADTTGKWKTTFIELMTGSNSQMVHLTTLGSFDGTDATQTTTKVPCPKVSPHSAIYFYQFTAAGQPATWTGRFVITDASGSTTNPSEATQPDGSNIPWGTGTLVDATGSAPPPTAPGGQVDGSSGNTSTNSSSSSASSTGSSSSGASMASSPSASIPPTSAPPAASSRSSNAPVATLATSNIASPSGGSGSGSSTSSGSGSQTSPGSSNNNNAASAVQTRWTSVLSASAIMAAALLM